MNSLAVMITTAQVEAAGRLYGRLRQWPASEAVLKALAERFPGFSDDAVLLKAVAINGLYGTNVLALSRMTIHAKNVVEKSDLSTAGPDLVEEIARLPANDGGQATRRHHSFAAKFAHFFIDPERFPIMDSYAVRMVKFHLGLRNYKQDKERPYVAFVKNFKALKALAGLSATNRELDRYLWIAGEYLAFHKNPGARISGELRRLFTDSQSETAAELDALMPSILNKAFRSDL